MFRPVCCRERTSTCVCLSLFGRPETRLLMSSDKDEKGFFEPPIFEQDCGGPADTYEFIFLLSHPPLFYFLCFLAAIISVQTAGVKLRSSDTYNSWVQIFFESAFIQAVVYYSHPLEKETHRLFIYTFLLCMNVSPDRWSINIMELHKQSTGKGGPFFLLSLFNSSFYLLVSVSNVQKHFTRIAIWGWVMIAPHKQHDRHKKKKTHGQKGRKKQNIVHTKLF